MNNEQIKDLKLERELSNPVYDIVNEGITYTMKKYLYEEYDLVKLVIMIYEKDYSYISNDNDYREQIKLMDEYFIKEYNHSIITLEMIKYLTSVEEEKFNDLSQKIAYAENLFRTNDKKMPKDLSIFSKPIKTKKYDDLMYFIEKNVTMKYAVAFVYNHIKYEEYLNLT
ncbi:MAG: hypothetical protein IKD77_03840 [Bacilli bacterium]|nr:hypothetical protein [Bacilli bacterium]